MKKTIMVYFATTVTILLMVASCKKDNGNGNTVSCTDGAVNFPFLASGHQVVYALTALFTQDTETCTFGAESNGKFPVKVSFTDNPGSNYTVYNWACGKNLNENINPVNNRLFWFSLDSKIGDTWTYVTNDTAYYQLIDTNASVTTLTNMQTFTHCYEFTFNEQGTINTDTIYFRTDLGEVYYNGLLLNYEMIKHNF